MDMSCAYVCINLVESSTVEQLSLFSIVGARGELNVLYTK